MVYIYSSVCVHRSPATREFTLCVHTHQCVFVEVQWLESSHGAYILDGWFARAFIQKMKIRKLNVVYYQKSMRAGR